MAESRIRVEHGKDGIKFHLPGIASRSLWFLPGLLCIIIIGFLVLFILTIVTSGGFNWVENSAFLILTVPGIIALCILLLNTTMQKTISLGSSGFRIRGYLAKRMVSEILVPIGQIKAVTSKRLPGLYINKSTNIEAYYILLRQRGQFEAFLNNEAVKPRFYDRWILTLGNFGSLTSGGGVVIETKHGAQLIICDYLTKNETDEVADGLSNELQKLA